MSGVYVILVNWNGWGDTLECLESLLRSDYADLRVIVCDNGSKDGSLDHLRAWAEGRLEALPPQGALKSLSFPALEKPLPYLSLTRRQAEAGARDAGAAPRLVLIDNEENLGFAGGNNVALRYALSRDDFSHAWLLNNDTAVAPDALSRLMERMAQKPQAGICGSPLLAYGEADRVQAQGGGYYCRWIGLAWHIGRLKRAGAPVDPARVERCMNYVVGASMLVSKRFLQEVGLLCEDYFLYFEEADWALRAHGRFTLAWAPLSIVHHKIGRSIGTSSNPRDKSATCDFYNIRNRLFFTRRYFPAALPTVYLALVGTLLARILLGKWDRVAMLLKLMLGPADAQTHPCGRAAS